MRKLIKHVRFYQLYYFDMIKKMLGAKKEYNDLIYMAQKSVAHCWSGETDPCLQYTVVMNLLQQDSSVKKGLELGGGYSTVILTKLVIENGCELTSVDVFPEKYNYILPNRAYRKQLFSMVEIVEDLTIDFTSLLKYYETGLMQELAKHSADDFKASLEKYVVPYFEDASYLKDCKDPLAELYTGEKFDLYKSVLSKETVEAEREFYASFDRVEKKGFIDQIVKNKVMYDFIFFDCGELSSLVEWVMLKEQINIGGYAILHDIYFPKSVKNYIVAALIDLSDEWEIIYQDSYSKQGMLVAKRLS